MTNQTQTKAAMGGMLELLMQSGDALKNKRALQTLGATALAGILIMFACAVTRIGFLIAIGALLTSLLVYAGFSAVGIQLMDQARGRLPRPLVQAIVDGGIAALKLFALAILAGLAVFVFVLALALVFLICKIPVLGTLLLVPVVPAVVLALAFLFAGLYFSMAMVGPAVWSGASIKEAVALLVGLAMRRMVATALGTLLHTMLMSFVSLMVFGFVGAASVVVGGIGAGVLAAGSGGFNSRFGGGLLDMGMGMVMSMEGSLSGLAFGFAVLFALVSALLLQMFLLGLNRLFLYLTEGEVATPVGEFIPNVPVPKGPHCPKCLAEVEPHDKFCEQCGNPLKEA